MIKRSRIVFPTLQWVFRKGRIVPRYVRTGCYSVIGPSFFLCFLRRWADHVARMEEGRSAFKILTGTRAGKRPQGRPRRGQDDNTRMDLKEIGINRRNLIDSAQDMDCWRALVKATLNFRVPQSMELVTQLKKSKGSVKQNISSNLVVQQVKVALRDSRELGCHLYSHSSYISLSFLIFYYMDCKQ